jgi:hypothetical protein
LTAGRGSHRQVNPVEGVELVEGVLYRPARLRGADIDITHMRSVRDKLHNLHNLQPEAQPWVV